MLESDKVYLESEKNHLNILRVGFCQIQVFMLNKAQQSEGRTVSDLIRLAVNKKTRDIR